MIAIIEESERYPVYDVKYNGNYEFWDEWKSGGSDSFSFGPEGEEFEVDKETYLRWVRTEETYKKYQEELRTIYEKS